MKIVRLGIRMGGLSLHLSNEPVLSFPARFSLYSLLLSGYLAGSKKKSQQHGWFFQPEDFVFVLRSIRMITTTRRVAV